MLLNYLYLGDCLDVLRHEIPDESVDLIYIDPPFNSKRNYNIFFDDKDIQTQRIAFEDTWSLKNIQDSLSELQSLKTEKIHRLLMTYSDIAPFAFSYLIMMSLRLLELRRVLKSTGSFYLHCDPTMSHYLKTMCDLIFSRENFRNEIIWCYTGPSRVTSNYPRKHDVILFYSKTNSMIFNHDNIRIPYSDESLSRMNRNVIKKGGTIYNEVKLNANGKIPEDWWSDIVPASRMPGERLGYPTQKPKALLERIIRASSNEGDTVLDAFCGCGTTVDAAEGLKRNWKGIDISPVAISLIKRRIGKTYGKVLSKYEVRGTPKDEQSAIRLWEQNPFAFQDWWITELEAFSTTYAGKGADRGVDGIAKYAVDGENTIKAAFQVKGGKVESKDIDALLGTMDKHRCELGVFLTINEPTKPMLETVATSGTIKTPGYSYPRLQVLTLSEFFSNKYPKLPKSNITFDSAKLKGKSSMEQITIS
jgi:site-specific DNA-methyltransferase (adenine-specific)